MKQLSIEVRLKILAIRQRVSFSDQRIDAARVDALLYLNEGASPKDAVEWPAVHAFKFYGLDPCSR